MIRPSGTGTLCARTLAHWLLTEYSANTCQMPCGRGYASGACVAASHARNAQRPAYGAVIIEQSAMRDAATEFVPHSRVHIRARMDHSFSCSSVAEGRKRRAFKGLAVTLAVTVPLRCYARPGND